MEDELRAAWQRHAAARQRFREMAVQAVPRPKMIEQAKRLGLPVDQGEMAQLGEDELAYLFDLAIYSAPPGRSRAIDRVVRQHARLRGEAVLVLNALSSAWFSIFRVTGLHPDGGLLLEDALGGGEVWVVDEGLSEVAELGAVVATRLGRVAGYAMTCGVMAVLDDVTLDGIRQVARRSGVEPAALVDEPRFVEGLWRRALGFG
ncbi:hypothetical protein QWZ14_14865 [Paeniroseomonas aquatica]|uniref:Uncharacterized protein n=2 Tax=Paeniroseomonas aquatica TaxID=373043 RepID=A0ABT8A7D0_9PROT|nr:hypothetical protein [Paeniroseomonas aquatica]MDN3565647.1 hypothetical protein [Paeniroseomonas aquatica]